MQVEVANVVLYYLKLCMYMYLFENIITSIFQQGFPFLYQQIKDNINPHQTKHLIHALCRWDDRLANQIITMLFSSVTKHTELCGPFFKLLTLLTETQGGPSGLPCFSQLVLQRVWDAAEYCPQSALDWLAFQAPKNKIAHAWILQSADNWVEQYLLAHNNSRVRNGIYIYIYRSSVI